MTAALDGILRFDEVTFREVHATHNSDVVICEYDAILTRFDLDDQFRRRYISVLTLDEGRIASLREYGGPFQPVDSAA